MSEEYDDELDARGLKCPLPILKTKRQLVGLDAGARLHVMATDPHSEIDFKAFCAKTENVLDAYWETGEVFHFVVRKPD
ncbi:sulfurtransferase TusA family protein [Ectothiorhodospiraceae bacterium WFHF3C12]|nr:sulfurtransferase TusA family protein [Ectothiorhodospiraceae bacterium WFHF3C12]